MVFNYVRSGEGGYWEREGVFESGGENREKGSTPRWKGNGVLALTFVRCACRREKQGSCMEKEKSTGRRFVERDTGGEKELEKKRKISPREIRGKKLGFEHNG